VLKVLPRLESVADAAAPATSEQMAQETKESAPPRGEAAATAARAAGGDFAFHVDDVHVRPGDRGVVVRILATTSLPAQAFGFSLRVDPDAAALRRVSPDETVAKASEYDQFLWQRHLLDQGVTASGCLYDTMENRGRRFPAGEFQHAASVILDIPAEAPDGARVRIDLGAFGDPPHACLFTITEPETMRATSRPARDVDGWVLVGTSPVPSAAEFRAARVEGEQAVKLTWRLAGGASAMRLERDGVLLKELPPGTAEYVDRDAPRTALEYRLWVRRGEAESFPATARVGRMIVGEAVRAGDAANAPVPHEAGDRR
jgi:hypothetical protein